MSGIAQLPLLPPQADRAQEFHWLEFNGETQLWRWHKDGWCSVYVPDARFSASELAAHGWRYVQAWHLPAAIAAAKRQVRA